MLLHVRRGARRQARQWQLPLKTPNPPHPPPPNKVVAPPSIGCTRTVGLLTQLPHSPPLLLQITHTLEFLEFDTAVLQLPISRLRTANVRLTPVELDSEMAKAHKLGIRLVYFAACTEAPWVPEILAKCARDGHHVSHKVFYLGDVDVALATETQHPGTPGRFHSTPAVPSAPFALHAK